MKATLFISDIHLHPNEESLEKLFSHFLEGPARQVERLYILGDLFHLWIGADIFSDLQTRVQGMLHDLTQTGVEVFFIAGNRDFLLTDDFFKKANCTKLPDPSCITLYGVPTLLTHGDSLCTKDVAYQRYRKFATRKWIQASFLALPSWIREKIGSYARQKSRAYQKTQARSIGDVCPETVQAIMNTFQVKQMIHGHVHKPAFHTLNYAHRFVLGDWHTKASFIYCTPNQYQLGTYTENGLQEIQKTYFPAA